MENKIWMWFEKHVAIGQIVCWTVIFATHPIRTLRFWTLYFKESFMFGYESGKNGDVERICERTQIYINQRWTELFNKVFKGTNVMS